jgi:hypothetical protein
MILWFFLSNFAHANPAALEKLFKIIGGIVALGIARLLAIRGRIDIALLIGSLGAGSSDGAASPSPISASGRRGLPAELRVSARD